MVLSLVVNNDVIVCEYKQDDMNQSDNETGEAYEISIRRRQAIDIDEK